MRAYATNSEGTSYGDTISFKTADIQLPEVTTTEVSNITSSTAESGGNVIFDGGGTISTRGICWSTGINPTIADNNTNDGTGTGSFTSDIIGLTEATTYYVRAYATNGAGISYGDTVSFQTQQLPVVTTSIVDFITNTGAQCEGEVISQGSEEVTVRGFCWSAGDNPTIADDTTNNGSGTGEITGKISGLTAGTTYYVRVYATSNLGTGYGTTVSFTTPEMFSDIDGNVYKTVKIGSQTWMAENLKVTQYRNGNAIPQVTNDTTWGELSTGAYCNYDNDPSNAITYGRLYNWNAIDDDRNIAPTGWHVPTDDEWKQLEMHLGMSQSQANLIGHDRGTDQGGQMKETGTVHWSFPNTETTNKSGFTALPSGNRDILGRYFNMSERVFIWSNTLYLRNGTEYAITRQLYYGNAKIYRGWSFKESGFSVRLVKD